ncbi:MULTISPECIES: PAAR domain-containing protein [unclassified Pseudomonas]|uniref:PAAR domain-containing protein n=1 Tax=unclassified Pseudomonas TaxID=196821 RepID=UPI002AC968D7|nr:MULTISPECIES: PAAR domain-containing protein [unclassified Pseudomonas]MEB0047946.1 PAAR domain-containing protein [Pseudomonas sp. Dout3]MEB0098847.1 PAAR domain-containing protein [Pseudomonas sp. DC1.2]WPX59126.1 PAAR domain-containing protein [Pseudomonas sp. DC1.2]
MAKPAARKSDPYNCPLPGHGTNPIASGSPDVFFDGLPAARQGDTCTCGSALSAALSPTVFINGKNAATIDTGGTHGGIVIGGSGTVIIGGTHTPCEFVPPAPLTGYARWIGFRIPADESYEGLSCTAHFEDGSSLPGVFDGQNAVKFSNPSGKTCVMLKFEDDASSAASSLTESFLNRILG